MVPNLPIVVITTDPPEVVASFMRDLKRLYDLQLPFLTDVGGQTTAVYCGGQTPRAFLVDERGCLRLQQEYREGDREVTLRILKELGGEVRVHTAVAQEN